MEEIWRDLKGFEEKFKISSTGIIVNKYNNTNVKTRISKDGYVYVSLYYNKRSYIKTLHRLVAKTFICCNDDKSLEVNHIDGNKLNNNITNLEWVTHKDNVKHAWANELFEPVRKASRRYGKDNPAAKRIIQYDINKNKIKEYSCIAEAVKETKINKTSIGKCCNHRQKTAGGYVWKFDPPYTKIKIERLGKRCVGIQKIHRSYA